MTFDERAGALEPLGFTARQTRFLAIVALHSGYCLRRHYPAFAGVRNGKNIAAFFDAPGRARQIVERFALPGRSRPRLPPAHACGLPSLDQEDNRNRRVGQRRAHRSQTHACSTTSSAQPEVRWLATERREGRDFFTQTYGVSRGRPAAACYGVTDPSMGVSRPLLRRTSCRSA